MLLYTVTRKNVTHYFVLCMKCRTKVYVIVYCDEENVTVFWVMSESFAILYRLES
jgi:hypothetical protein